MDLDKLIVLAINGNASDLHLAPGIPPIIRVDGELQRLHLPPLEQANMSRFIAEIMNEEQHKVYQNQHEIDFALQFNDQIRIRVSIFSQLSGTSAVFRFIPLKIKTMEELGLPASLKQIASFPNGLVLITGSSGTGKSTTLAALIHYINSHCAKHIITLEDPIEFIHISHHSLINQREVYTHTADFSAGLRSALRADPNIIVLGELRDSETIRLAMTAAETGHLVFASLHANSANKAINRIIDSFPSHERSLISSLLSESLQAIVAQTLMKKAGGGRIAACEILICTPAIRNLIRENKIAQIYSSMQTGHHLGMQTFDQHVTMLLAKQLIV